MNNTITKWEELPKELLEIIGQHLDSRIEVFRFRATSAAWRSAVPFSHLQSQVLSLNIPYPSKTTAPKTTATLTPFTLCRLEDETKSSACLVKVIESKSSGMLELVNPLISHKSLTLCSSPSNHTNDDDNNTTIININNATRNDKTISLLDFRLVEVIKGYSFKFEKFPSGYKVKKAIMCDHNGGILALFESGTLKYWGSGDDDKWTDLGNAGSYYDDILCYKGQYYVIDSLGVMSWIDHKLKNLIQYAPPLCGLGQLKNLVASDGEFYVVDSYLDDDGAVAGDPFSRCRFRKVGIKVYKLDEEWGTWVDVQTIGSRVFVLGKENCFAVDVKDYPGCQGDCIFFVDPRMEDRNIRGKPKRLVRRVFRFDNRSIRTVDCFPDYNRLFCPSMNRSNFIMHMIPRVRMSEYHV